MRMIIAGSSRAHVFLVSMGQSEFTKITNGNFMTRTFMKIHISIAKLSVNRGHGGQGHDHTYTRLGAKHK